MTIISLLWLADADLKRPFVRAIQGVFSQAQLTHPSASPTDTIIAAKVHHKNAVEAMTLELAAIVKTNSILLAPELDTKDRGPATIDETLRGK